ncbi:hypothetical protein [Tsukamurella tyrosinosolvens]|uniref:hypothetical protein n=1 Tax=Tsukamurella tyrosinosolvens TaxID=57704 RepID=UPI00125F5948|nr:hypothetical protein [Tsukamurella tyrosinosolvens]
MHRPDAPPRTAAEVLADARTTRSADKRTRIYATVDKLQQTPHPPITFSAVARAAHVSRWLVYTDDIRQYIEQAQQHQQHLAETQNRNETARGKQASSASLRTDLAHSREQIRKQRAQITRPTTALRKQVGAQLDHESNMQLRQRIDELVAANNALIEQNTQLKHKLEASATDLQAARVSLKQMIREASTRAD